MSPEQRSDLNRLLKSNAEAAEALKESFTKAMDTVRTVLDWWANVPPETKAALLAASEGQQEPRDLNDFLDDPVWELVDGARWTPDMEANDELRR